MTRADLIKTVLHMLLDGKDVTSIIQETGLDPADIQTIKKQALGLADTLPQKRKNPIRKRHKLTKEERQRGQRRGQATRARNRVQTEAHIMKHIFDTGNRARLAAITYFLGKGSRKELVVTAGSPEVAGLLVQALKDIGVPDDAIICHWRNVRDSLPENWKDFSHPIAFSNDRGPNSMRIRVRPFKLRDGTKVSSRSLGQAFYKLGQFIIAKYAG